MRVRPPQEETSPPPPADAPAFPAALDLMRSVWAVDRALQELSRVMALHLGVTGQQRLILRVIGERPGISPKDIAAILALDPSTLTGHLQRLEGDGLLARGVVPEDARRQRLELTEEGRRLDARMPGTVEAAVEEVLTLRDHDDISAARQVLEDLAEALREQAKKCASIEPPRPPTPRPRRR
jgi:MarR family transcriptional regulator, organic hydroperoxide resistance regulator